MNFFFTALISTAGLFFGMLLFSEIGRRIGLTRLRQHPEGLAQGVGAAESAVFGLLGLIIAFTFSGAAARFEARRHLITEEANAVGTAYLRLDLLSPGAQLEMRSLFRHYLDLRTASYQNLEDTTATRALFKETAAMQNEIWQKALIACRRPEAPSQAMMLLLPALNEMIDITTTRAMAGQNHPPLVVYILLAGLSLMGALLVGYDMAGNKERSLLHTFAFAAIMALALYVIVDLEFPRLGLISIDAADQVLIDLRKSMG